MVRLSLLSALSALGLLLFWRGGVDGLTAVCRWLSVHNPALQRDFGGHGGHRGHPRGDRDRDRPQGAVGDRASAPADRHHSGLHELAYAEGSEDPQERLQLLRAPRDLCLLYT